MESTGGPWRPYLVRLRLLLIGRRGFFGGCRRVVYHVLKFFAGFEVGNLLSGHFDAGASFWIASNSRLALARAEAAKSADLNLVAATEGLHDAVEDGLDDDLGLLAGHLHHARDLFNQIRLGHVYASLRAPKTMFSQQITDLQQYLVPGLVFATPRTLSWWLWIGRIQPKSF